MRRLWWALALFLVAVVLLPGCGRFRKPGWDPNSVANTDTTTTPKGEPMQPVLAWGDENAKVRLIGFFYIDTKDPVYQRTMELFESLAKQYQGKVFVRYWDLRTQEGRQARVRAGGQTDTVGLLLDGRSEVTIQAKPQPYTVQFVQAMGRYWTAEDLKAAVAQEVARVYGTAR